MTDTDFTSPSLAHSLREIKQSIWYRIGTLHEDMNDYDAALTAFEKVLIHNPSNAAARAKAGILLMKKECYRDAIAYLHSAVSLSPDNHPAWVALAYSYVMSDELDNAYQAYHTAMCKVADHNDPMLWFGVGIMYDRMGLLDHALDAFHAVLNMSPHFEAADKVCYDIGLIYKEQHKYELAHKYMTQVVSTKAQQPAAYAEALYQIGHIHELAGNIPSAMEAYHGALNRNPNHIKCLQSLGWLTYKSGNVDEATRLLARSSQIEPTDAYTFYMIGRMAMATNDYHKAYENYQHAVLRDGKNANFWCAIGILYFHMRQHRDAMDAYTRAIHINPHMPEVWYDMGTLYEVHNQINDAMDAYGRVLRLQANDSQAAQRLATLQHAASNGVMPPAPSALPRTEGPVVSPNPASATRTHTRSEAPERIGALPAPPRAPKNLSSAPASYQMPIPTANRRSDTHMETERPIASVATMPMTSGQVNPKGEPAIANQNISMANGIVADSTADPMSSQGQPYPNGRPGNMVGNGPTGYSTLNDRGSSITGAPPANVAEASSQLSSLNKSHSGAAFNPSGVPQEPGSSRPLDRILTQDRIPPGSSGQVMHASQPQNNTPLQASQLNGSPPRSLPPQSIPRGPTPAFGISERQEPWNSSARHDGYEDGRIVRSDSNRSNPARMDVHPDQSHYGTQALSQPHAIPLDGAPRATYHSIQTDPARSQAFQSHADKSQGHRGLQPQPRQANPVAPLGNAMPSDDRSRLSASSSYERRAAPAEGLRPTTPNDASRVGGDGSARSAENENRYESPGSRNSRRSLPTPRQGPPPGFSTHSQGVNMSHMGRGDDHLDEAMLPRLRPLPDPKPRSPTAETDKKGNTPLDREGPLASVRRIDDGMQSGAHGNWANPPGQNSRRGSLHGTPQQVNETSPQSQRSPHDNRISREQTGLSGPNEVTTSREHAFGNGQAPADRQQQSGPQQTADGHTANISLSNEPSRFHEDQTGNHMKHYSSQASLSSRDAKVDHPSSGEIVKGEGQAQQQSPVLKHEGYGSSRPYAGNSLAPGVEAERGQFRQPIPGSDRANIVPQNGYHGGAPPNSTAQRPDPSAGSGEMRATTNANATDGHFGAGTPPSFSKPLPRTPASNGLMSTPVPGKETENVVGQGRAYYELTQGSYGSAEKGPTETPNGYSSSPRGSKRKMSDLVDGRTEGPNSKQYAREQGDGAVPEGKIMSSGLARPDPTVFPRINARALPEPMGAPRGDAEDISHAQKRIRSHGMTEDELGSRMNGGQLKSRE